MNMMADARASTLAVQAEGAYRDHQQGQGLSNGSVMVEQEIIAPARAANIREILSGLGIPQASVKVSVISTPAATDGINDAWSRKVTLSVNN